VQLQALYIGVERRRGAHVPYVGVERRKQSQGSYSGVERRRGQRQAAR